MATAKLSDIPSDDHSRPATLAGGLPFGLILLTHGPLLYVYFLQLWDRPHYQFFPLVLLAFGYFVTVRWPERQTPSRRAVAASRLLLLGSATVLAFSIARLSPLAAYLSGTVTIGAFLLRMGVPALGPWALLLLMLRIPYGHDVAAIQMMQRVTTRLSSTALDTIGVEHFPEGNILVFPSQTLFVEEACSGVVSMLAMVACAAMMAVWWRRSLLHGLLLMATGVLWAGAMNVIRVVGIAITLSHYDVDLTEGWRHEAMGLFAFAVSLGALLSTDRLLLFLLGPIGRNPLAGYWTYAEENRLVPLWNLCAGPGGGAGSHESYGDHTQDWDAAETDENGQQTHVASPPAGQCSGAPRRWEWAIVPVFLLLGAAQVVAGIGPFSAAPAVRQVAIDLSANDLPEDLNGWKRIGFEAKDRDSSSAFGEHSRIWSYQRGGRIALLSLDFVFPEWHSLSRCYEGTGWQILSRTPIGHGTTRIETLFTKPGGENAYLIFDLFDSQGQDYVVPGKSILHRQLRRIMSGEANRYTLPSYYQAQLLVELPGGVLSEDDQQEIRQLFLMFEANMRSKLAE